MRQERCGRCSGRGRDRGTRVVANLPAVLAAPLLPAVLAAPLLTARGCGGRTERLRTHPARRWSDAARLLATRRCRRCSDRCSDRCQRLHAAVRHQRQQLARLRSVAQLRRSRRHWLAIADDCCRHDRHGVAFKAIAKLARRLRVVDDLGDLGHVRDVGDVDVLDVGRAAAVARHKNLARRKRKPADHRLLPALTPDRDRHLHAGPSNPGDQRRRIDRAQHALPRHPEPAAAALHPAAVMERRKAPRGVVDPGPAPRLHPCPVACAVRCPAGVNATRGPDGAVVGVVVPAAVTVKLVGAGHGGRDIARGCDAVTALDEAITLAVPGCKRVDCRVVEAVLSRACGIEPELGAPPGCDRQATVRAFVAGLPGQDGDDAGPRHAGPPRRTRFAVNAVSSGALQVKTAGVGGDFNLARLRIVAHQHRDAALVQEHHEAVVVQRAHFKLGVGVEAHGGGAELQLGPRAPFGADPVGAGDRAVAHRADPFTTVRAVEPDQPGHIGQPGDARRRVGGQRQRPRRAGLRHRRHQRPRCSRHHRPRRCGRHGLHGRQRHQRHH